MSGSPEGSPEPTSIKEACALEADLFNRGFVHDENFTPGLTEAVFHYAGRMVAIPCATVGDYVKINEAHYGAGNVV